MNDLWPYAVVPDFPNVFVCGCFERWVSIHLQAIRGFNLAWALAKERGVARVTVVGGGFAGLACAAGLGRLGVQVTLLERNPELLATQRHNHVRFIHPHLHQWPRPGCLDPRAELPMLGWSAGRSSEMAREVLDGFAAEVKRSNIDVQLGVKTVDLGAHETVVLALGVGVEKTFGALPLRSYWADAHISVEHPGTLRHHLVTGIGEGGVIDALYLRLRDFSHQRFAEAFASMPGMKAVDAELLALEEEVASLDDAAANERLSRFAQTFEVPREVDAFLEANLRTDTQVTLNGPERFPLAARRHLQPVPARAAAAARRAHPCAGQADLHRARRQRVAGHARGRRGAALRRGQHPARHGAVAQGGLPRGVGPLLPRALDVAAPRAGAAVAGGRFHALMRFISGS